LGEENGNEGLGNSSNVELSMDYEHVMREEGIFNSSFTCMHEIGVTEREDLWRGLRK
jgi:hypothetical protein